MRGLITYYRPRGIYGRVIVTLYFRYEYPKEVVSIQAFRPVRIYNNYLEQIIDNRSISETEKKLEPNIVMYRYEGTEPGDSFHIRMEDAELLIFQGNEYVVTQQGVALQSSAVHKQT